MSTLRSVRGSLWHRWDPHIHCPGTVLSDQYKAATGWEDFLQLVENSEPRIRVLGVTDYLSLRSYERVVAYKAEGRLPDVDLIFPNVEMRFGLQTAKSSHVNVHLLISPEQPDHLDEARRFLSRLSFQAFDDVFRCEEDDLIRLGKRHDPSLREDEAALRAGTNQFKVGFEQLKKEFRQSDWAQNNALVAVAGGSQDGTSGLAKDASYATQRREYERFARVIFASSPAQIAFWTGQGKLTSEELNDGYGGCKLCLHGSDAHREDKVGKPDLDRLCWIKGDLTFEALRQAYIEPSTRAFIGPTPPTGALPSQAISEIEIRNASWLPVSKIPLNTGLVAVIGARGSGKTALADFIAAGANSLSAHLNEKSFIRRAAAHLGDAEVQLSWQSGETTSAALSDTGLDDPDLDPRVQYLSQQFVGQLCSAEGITDALLAEIERVVFQAHVPEDRMEATDFQDLLEQKAASPRTARARHERALAEAGETLNVLRHKKHNYPTLKKQLEQKAASIAKDKKDRLSLLGKGGEDRAKRLEEVSTAVDSAFRNIERQKRALRQVETLRDYVRDFRTTEAESQLAGLKETSPAVGFSAPQWEQFRLDFKGDVDQLIVERADALKALILSLNGPAQGEPEFDASAPASSAPLVADGANLNDQTHSLLKKELARLQKLVGIDLDNTRRFRIISEKISKDEAAIVKLSEQVDEAGEADELIRNLNAERKLRYQLILDAIIAEETELGALYAPLAAKLGTSTGTLGKLSFRVKRLVDAAGWAARGEELLDLRKAGDLKGKGTLLRLAQEQLVPAWTNGSATEVADALTHFREAHETAILSHAIPDRSDREEFMRWASRVGAWLYDTSHIRISYSIEYDGVAIEQLSPGTRGIVLLLLYLAIDAEDDRPLIVDQPEENLDPKSVFDDLVHLFKIASRRRQIIIVTHNANLVVNTDVDQVIVAQCGPHRPGMLPIISYQGGGLEDPAIRQSVCDILEGGQAAFRERAKRLRVSL